MLLTSVSFSADRAERSRNKAPVTLQSWRELSAAARLLFKATGRSDGSWEWFDVLAETTLEPGEKAVAVVLGDPGEERAVLPLVASQAGTMRALTAPYSCRYSPPLGAPNDAAALGAGMRRHVNSVWLDCLDPADASSMALEAGCRRSGLWVTTYDHFANWYEPVAGFDAYWDRRPTRLRETVRRKLRRAENAGRIAFECIEKPADLARGAEIYSAVYARSWKQPEPHLAFIPTLIERLGRQGSLRLGIASLDGTPVAVQIWLVTAGRATIFKLAHIDGTEADSPGTLLTWWLFSQLVGRDNLTEIDFGRGGDGYKKDWLDCQRRRIGAVICNPLTVGGLRDGMRHITLPWAARSMNRLLKAYPRPAPETGSSPPRDTHDIEPPDAASIPAESANGN